MHWGNFVGWNMDWVGTAVPWLPAAILIITVWALVWKGMALWKAARVGSKGWFVVLLIVNTLGILEILYIYVFSRKNNSSVGSPQ